MGGRPSASAASGTIAPSIRWLDVGIGMLAALVAVSPSVLYVLVALWWA